MSVQKHLVARGHGLTILPVIAVTEDLAQKRFSAAPLSRPTIIRKLAMATSTVRPMRPPLLRVVEELTRCIEASIVGGEWLAARWLGP